MRQSAWRSQQIRWGHEQQAIERHGWMVRVLEKQFIKAGGYVKGGPPIGCAL